MTRVFAFECFADRDVFSFLRKEMKLAIEGLHSGSQGNVINNLQKGLAEIGMVDEDPRSTHHPIRSQMQIVWNSDDLEHRVKGDRHPAILNLVRA